MNFKKRVNGSWVDTPNYIHKTDTDTFTTFPAVLYPTGTTATVGLKGNTVQSGTPTPQSPVMPQGTGERTGNLFASVWERGSINGTTGQNEVVGTLVRTKDYIPIKPNTAYSFNRDIANGYMNVRLYRADKSYIGAGTTSAIRLISGTSPGNPMGNNTSFCCFEVIDGEAAYIRFNDSSNNTATKWLMVEGEYTWQTMPDYEPYGIKIPILSNSTTTNVYLGEMETTRRIRKLVFDGTENWKESSDTNIYIALTPNQGVAWTQVLSTHFTPSQVQTNGGLLWFVNANVDFDTVEECKFYLAQQYAAGTPVTVWYVLATETTGIVNEPIRKIGDYADTVSGITIPTIAGANTLSVGTTVQPSEVSVNYKGWHPVQSVHERENGQWD